MSPLGSSRSAQKNEKYSHTSFACLVVFDAWVFGGFVILWALVIVFDSLAYMVASRLWRYVTSCLGSSRSVHAWRLVSDRHDPPTFSGVGVHYLKFTSGIPFRDMTSGVTVETVGNDSWRVATSRQAVAIPREASPLLRPVSERVYWTWVHVTGDEAIDTKSFGVYKRVPVIQRSYLKVA